MQVTMLLNPSNEEQELIVKYDEESGKIQEIECSETYEDVLYKSVSHSDLQKLQEEVYKEIDENN